MSEEPQFILCNCRELVQLRYSFPPQKIYIGG